MEREEQQTTSKSGENPLIVGDEEQGLRIEVGLEESDEMSDHQVMLSNLLENTTGNVQKASKIVSITGVPYTSPASLLMKRVDNPKPPSLSRGSSSKSLVVQIINDSNANDSLKTT